jgi:phosphopantothenoylcysteine decarboxylase/phosphopantothenate--cysteine ligase
MSGSDARTGTRPRRILLQVSGSIAAFKAVALTSKLVQAGDEVEVVLSQGATAFVGAASFEGLTGRRVHTSTFDEGRMMAHIDLERWADLILLYPATAQQLGALANGLGTDLISTLFLAHEFKKPYLIAPAMNPAMWSHPMTRANLARLREVGVRICEPDAGRTACGEEGTGRLVEPEAMLALIDSALGPSGATAAGEPAPHPIRILVTAGGTQEPIDPVRSITNVSTGRTGHALARALSEAGHEVTLVQSASSPHRDGLARVRTYTTTGSMAQVLEQELTTHDYDLAIHAAAVSDFRVEQVSKTKLPSGEGMTLQLVPNPKLVARFREWSRNPRLRVMSFKLTAGASAAELGEQLARYDSDWIVHNELSDVGTESHAGTIYSRDRSDASAQVPVYRVSGTFQTKTELGARVRELIARNFGQNFQEVP